MSEEKDQKTYVQRMREMTDEERKKMREDKIKKRMSRVVELKQVKNNRKEEN